MSDRSICRVILATGDSCNSSRAEADDSLVLACRDLIVRIGAGSIAEAAPMLSVSGYSISGRVTRKCMLVAVWADGPPPERVASIAAARDERRGLALWCTLHRIAEVPIVTNPEHQPAIPWCATLLEPGLARHGDATRWLGALERCLAWAWLERRSIARTAGRKVAFWPGARSPMQ